MRILCSADLHLGASPGFGREPYGPGSRLADQAAVWMRVCELAVAENVDAVLFAGDGFHHRRPTPAEILAFRAGLDELCRHGIPVFAVNGNHDVSSAEQPSALSIFEGELELWRQPGVRHFPAIGLEQQCSLAFLPWTPPAHLVAERGGGDRDELHRDVAEILVDVARGLRGQCADDVPAILVAHWSVSGASTPTGVPTDQFREPMIPLAELEAMGWDYIVLGHIHRPQFIYGAAAFYCGSPCVIDFGEADTEHGVYLLDVEGDAGMVEFRPIEDRPFVTVDLDCASDDSPDAVENHFTAWFECVELPPDAVVRVRYRATPEQAKRADHRFIERGLYTGGRAHKVVGIIPDIVRADRARVQGVDETLGPREAFERYLGLHDPGELGADLVRAKRDELLERAGVA